MTKHNKDTKDTKNMYHWFGTFLSKSVSRVSLAIPPRLLHRSHRRTKKELAKEFDDHVIGRFRCQVERVIDIFYGLCSFAWLFLLWKLIVMIVRIQAALGSEMISFLTLFAITRNFVHALKLQSMIFHL